MKTSCGFTSHLAVMNPSVILSVVRGVTFYIISQRGQRNTLFQLVVQRLLFFRNGKRKMKGDEGREVGCTPTKYMVSILFFQPTSNISSKTN